MSFSGTYGELRHDHFHGGLDWRVGGKVGDDIHVIKSGYISRVSVSPWGYGNGIYVTHPDGTTSVYGHLLRFCEPVARRVEGNNTRVRVSASIWNSARTSSPCSRAMLSVRWAIPVPLPVRTSTWKSATRSRTCR